MANDKHKSHEGQFKGSLYVFEGQIDYGSDLHFVWASDSKQARDRLSKRFGGNSDGLKARNPDNCTYGIDCIEDDYMHLRWQE